MWAEAAKALAAFPTGVLNAIDAEGSPVSVRQASLAYDAQSGRMPVTIPAALDVREGPASVLCHYHDEKLWNQKVVLVRGRVERTGERWTFVTTSFTPPSMWQMLKGTRRATRSYLEKRGLEMPRVDFDVVSEMWKRVKDVTKG